MKIKTLFATLLTLALFTAGYAQTLDKAKLDQFFDRLAEKNKAMGSLTIAKDGNVLYTRAIGYSQINGTEKKPLTAATRFRIGSITKMFTAVMIFQLVEEGKLKLTDTLDKFFPQIPNAQKITIAQILAHRSGIPNVKARSDSQGNVNTIPMTKDEMLALIVKGTPDFEPDAKHSYSNSGYFLLGLILEKVTGKPYAGSPQGKNHFKDRAQGYIHRDRKHRCEQKRSSYLYSPRRRLETGTPKPIPASSSARARLFRHRTTWPNSSRRCLT